MPFSLASIKKAQKRRHSPAAPSLPPLGSYDPSILLQVGQNRRTSQNAQQQFDLGQAQAQDDTGIQIQRLGQSRDRGLADVLTGRARLGEDHTTALANLDRNYAGLAVKQAEGANRAHVESAGILAQALAARQANRTLDQQPLDSAFKRGMADSTTAEQRVGQDYSNQKADLVLGLSRSYGSGKGGQPLGSNTLNLMQTQGDAVAGNLDLSGVAYQQAAANGFRFPRRRRRNVIL